MTCTFIYYLATGSQGQCSAAAVEGTQYCTHHQGEIVRCALCGWVIEDPDLATQTRQGIVHFDRQCPKGEPKPAPRKRGERVAAERKLAVAAGLIPESAARPSAGGSHAECTHEATKSARAACRRARQKNAG